MRKQSTSFAQLIKVL